MRPERVLKRASAVTLVLAGCLRLFGQSTVVLPVQVSDATDRPIAHVTLSAKGDSTTSAPTDKSGKTHIALPGTFGPGSGVALVLVDSPLPNLRFLSPWEGRAVIPAHDAVEIVLGTPGDPGVLNNPQVRQSLRNAAMAKAAGAPGPNAADDAFKDIAATLKLNPMDLNRKLQQTAASDARADSSSQHKNTLQKNGPGNNPMQNNAMQNSSMQSRGRKH